MGKIQKVIAILKEEYGKVEFDFQKNPLDELIVTVLSQNTTWRNCRRAYKNLRRLGSWKKIVGMPERKIASAIRVGGLGNVKAKRIKEILAEIHKRTGRLSLEFLRNEKTDNAMEFLRSLKGVGPKTAAVVTFFSLRRPTLPVDTHILRVSKRLGLIPDDTTLERAHEILGSLVPRRREAIHIFHINMIVHGRRVCIARNPRCSDCALRRLCKYFKRMAPSP